MPILNRVTKMRLGRLMLILALILGLAGAASMLARAAIRLSEYPSKQAALLRERIPGTDPQARLTTEMELLQYETDSRIKIWTAIVQALGGGVLLFGLLFTWRNLRATQTKLDIDRQGQLTNRFILAAGQLGADKNGRANVEVRLGGIYALDRIARDWPNDYWPIMEVLTAYVRHNAPRAGVSPIDPAASGAPPAPRPRTDIQAVLTILGRPAPPERKLDLRETDLRGAEFWDAHLENTDLWGADLEGAQLWGAHLDGAKLEQANLRGANLRGTTWKAAVLTNASLTDADLREADLRGVAGLTGEQVTSAYQKGAGAQLPSSLRPPQA
jgi:hypothetical protein